MPTPVVTDTHIPQLTPFITGKVRDVYDLDYQLLVIATDRISAFDVVLPSPIPDKGRVLTGMSMHWFDLTKHLVANHLITAESGRFPEAFAGQAGYLAGRAMLVRKLRGAAVV